MTLGNRALEEKYTLLIWTVGSLKMEYGSHFPETCLKSKMERSDHRREAE
jgi:hypothetical protein